MTRLFTFADTQSIKADPIESGNFARATVAVAARCDAGRWA